MGMTYDLVGYIWLDIFLEQAYVETVCLLSKLNTKQHIEVEIKMDELDVTAAESKATYDEIKAYILQRLTNAFPISP